jgi:hypothetical protein
LKHQVKNRAEPKIGNTGKTIQNMTLLSSSGLFSREFTNCCSLPELRALGEVSDYELVLTVGFSDGTVVGRG